MDIRHKISEIYSFERLSAGGTVIHRLHPMCKLIAALFFIITVISFERHAFGRLIPYIFYPALITSLSETPYAPLFKRVLAVMPFCLFIGISNVFFERGAAFAVGNMYVSLGAVSFAVIIYRGFLCASAVILLMAVTPFTEITAQMKVLKIPGMFVIMFEMIYRYIGVLLDEAALMSTAYALRGAGLKGVDIRHAGAFAGSLLLRSFSRAERVYAAMKCRGYSLHNPAGKRRDFTAFDISYCAAVCLLCLFFRFADVGRLITGLAERIL